MEVYINDISSFLPNEPVSNDEIENVLGTINDIPSKTKKRMLANNKIVKRYYAIDPKTHKFTHTNAQLTAEAIRNLKPYKGFKLEDIQCLCCGSTSPDLIMPGHALMVAGELKLPPCDAVTTAGICIAGITSIKYACMNVATGSVENAVATGSELSSSYMRADYFNLEVDPNADIEKKPILAFNADFLRWMLSDGAGAVYVSGKKNETGISLKVEWIENYTYAGEFDTCMYAGGVKQEDGSIMGWREKNNSIEAATENFLAVKQDIKLLGSQIIKTFERALGTVVEKYGLKPSEIDWYLPHFSSDFFKDKFYQGMKEIDFEIPYEKWFTNLPTTGNIGSASIYVIMEEIFKSGKLKKGEKVLCFIPESGRLSHCFMMLTVC
jgi:3-oxoacyl-[acyl-carrier-protein] synthase-3